MSPLFEELDYRETDMGPLMLRRRRILSLDVDVLEVKLGEEFLMSSLFTVGEQALASLGLEAARGERLDVMVGGLGLGYTAAAALDEPRVASLTVIDALLPVIEWHQAGLVPLGARLTGDPRCQLRHGDFFAAVAAPAQGRTPQERWHAILLDIDHSPEALLNSRHGSFYSAEGLAGLAAHLHPGGVFAMWSDAGPDAAFMAIIEAVFSHAEARVVEFHNPLQDRAASCTIYIARV